MEVEGHKRCRTNRGNRGTTNHQKGTKQEARERIKQQASNTRTYPLRPRRQPHPRAASSIRLRITFLPASCLHPRERIGTEEPWPVFILQRPLTTTSSNREEATRIGKKARVAPRGEGGVPVQTRRN